MQAAEHGAQFPMARKLRSSMTHDQLHDFAVGSEAGKPEHVRPARPTRPPRVAPASRLHPNAQARGLLHPAMAEHGQMVREAHAHLSGAIAGFNQLPAAHRMQAIQEHIRVRKANGY